MTDKVEDEAWERYKFLNWINPSRDPYTEGIFRAGHRANKSSKATPEYEYGTRWPLSEEAHGPNTYRVYPNASREEAESVIDDMMADPDRDLPIGVVVVRRVKAGEWERVKNGEE